MHARARAARYDHATSKPRSPAPRRATCRASGVEVAPRVPRRPRRRQPRRRAAWPCPARPDPRRTARSGARPSRRHRPAGPGCVTSAPGRTRNVPQALARRARPLLRVGREHGGGQHLRAGQWRRHRALGPGRTAGTRGSGAGIQEGSVNLGQRAHGRSRIARRRVLADGDRRRESRHPIELRVAGLLQEPPGVRRQALGEAPLALANKVSKASDDLPLPDTPVTTVNWLRGNSASTPRRLCVVT